MLRADLKLSFGFCCYFPLWSILVCFFSCLHYRACLPAWGCRRRDGNKGRVVQLYVVIKSPSIALFQFSLIAFFFIGQSNLPHCALFQIFLLLCSFVFYLCKNMLSKILGSPIKGGRFRLAVDKCFFKPAVKQYCVSSRLSNIVF